MSESHNATSKKNAKNPLTKPQIYAIINPESEVIINGKNSQGIE